MQGLQQVLLDSPESLRLPRVRNPCGLVDTFPPVVKVSVGRLGGVQSDPDLRREAVDTTVIGQHALNSDSAINGRGRSLEGHEESIAGVIGR